MQTVHVRISLEKIRQVIASVPTLLKNDPSSQVIMARAGITVLGYIHTAFVTKSRGGTDDAGDRWEPLSPVTIARRRGRRRSKSSSRKSSANQSVDILRDTGALLNSLTPGYGGSNQLFKAEPGSITIGTRREGADKHHEGIPGKLPQRRLWPETSKWPATWWQDIAGQIAQGVAELVIQEAKGTK